MTDAAWQEFLLRLASASKVRLLLDYDGTLADFAPTPDVILQDPELISLLYRLATRDKFLLGIVSGRSLQHLRELLPFKGMLLAGTYGLEMQLPDGSSHAVVTFEQVRPIMERIKPLWQQQMDGQQGFFLEDKGWALALHARFAAPDDAQRVLAAARAEAEAFSPGPAFTIEHRLRFLEIYPVEANKRRSIDRILAQYTPPDALPVFAGDDTHDEEAFASVLDAGGYCIRVSRDAVETRAQFRLETPAQVRQWLAGLEDART